MSQKKAQLLNPLSGNINVTGVITASSFSGNASGLTGVGSTDNIQTSTQATFLGGVTISGVSTVGVVTGGTSVSASYYYGDGSSLSGIAKTDNIQTRTQATFLGGVTISGVSTVGVVTGGTSVSASYYYGDGSNLTGIDVTSLKDSGGNVKAQANPGGVVITGVATATTFSGNITGNLTGDVNAATFDTGVGGVVVTGVATATSFSGNITGNLTGDVNAATFDTGVGGVVVTGVATATTFSGELVGAAVTTSSAGLQATDVDLAGLLREQVTVTAGKLSDNTNIDLEDGMVHLFTTTETTTATPNIRKSSSTSLNSAMSTGEVASVTIVATAAAAGYAATVHIDGVTVGTNGGTLNWVGGSAPSDGGASGVDIYAYTIIKTASATYTVIATQTKTSA